MMGAVTADPQHLAIHPTWPAPVRRGLARWHEVVASRDAAALPAMVREDAVFRSPAVHRPQEGRDLVCAYLGAALVVLGPTITYHRTWVRDTGAVLEFTAVLGDREAHGVDVVEWDEDGLIRDFTVLVRPMQGLGALVEAMGAELQRAHG